MHRSSRRISAPCGKSPAFVCIPDRFLAGIQARSLLHAIGPPYNFRKGKDNVWRHHRIDGAEDFLRGTVFFFLFFLALSFAPHSQRPKRDMRQCIKLQTAEGKKRWETNNCIGCPS